MNPNQVRQNENSATPCAPQFQSGADKITGPQRSEPVDINISGIACTFRWERRPLAHYVLQALALLSEPIRAKTLPQQTDDQHLINLFEAVDFAISYRHQAFDDSKPLGVTNGVASLRGVSVEDAFNEICCTLVNNAELLIRTIYKKSDDPLGNCYLAESLCIAEHVAIEEGMVTPLDPGRLICLAEEARAAYIRHILTKEHPSDFLPRNARAVRSPRQNKAGQGRGVPVVPWQDA